MVGHSIALERIIASSLLARGINACALAGPIVAEPIFFLAGDLKSQLIVYNHLLHLICDFIFFQPKIVAKCLNYDQVVKDILKVLNNVATNPAQDVSLLSGSIPLNSQAANPRKDFSHTVAMQPTIMCRLHVGCRCVFALSV